MGSVDHCLAGVTVGSGHNINKTAGLNIISSMPNLQHTQNKIVIGDDGYVLEDVPHLSDYIPNLPVYSLFLYLSRICLNELIFCDLLQVHVVSY